jgi:hypothetical protein
MPSKSTRKTRSVKATKKPVKKLRLQTPKKVKKVEEKPKVFAKVPNVFRLSKITFDVFWQNRKFFIGLTLIYGILNLILVQGLASSTDINTIKTELKKVSSGNIGSIFSSLGIYTTLLESSGNNSSPTAGAYQIFLGLIASLAVIWSLRHIAVGKKIRIRDAYYKGMTPLIPFVLIILFIAIELIPMLLGAIVFSSLESGIARGTFQHVLAFLILLLGILWSLYIVVVPIIALYIVTLENMTPWRAIKLSKKLISKRRWTVVRKILFLPVLIVVLTAVVMVPIIVFITGITQWVFFLLTMLSLVAIHIYMYRLYRELLNEA